TTISDSRAGSNVFTVSPPNIYPTILAGFDGSIRINQKQINLLIQWLILCRQKVSALSENIV
ncbi:MAG: hypothetical protein V7677_20320, partial [Motiliproteus sp.]